MASGKVLDNFPERRARGLGHVTAAAFDPSSAWLCLGTTEGRAPLFRLHHWPKPDLPP